jgi:hypothetical protein
MKNLILTILMILSAQFCHAGIRIYSGGNISIFNKDNSFYRTRYIIGVDKTWENDCCGLSFGLQFIERSCFMKDIIKVFPNSDYGYDLDVLFSVRYIELPLLCSIQLKELHAVKIVLNFGPSLGISLGDNSKATFWKGFYIENPTEFISSTKNVYYEYDDPGELFRSQHFSGFYLNVGFNIEYRKIYAEFRYSHGINEFEYLCGLSMHGEKFRTYEFILGLYLNSESR